MADGDYKEKYEKLSLKYGRLKDWISKNPFGKELKFTSDKEEILSPPLIIESKKYFECFSKDYLDEKIIIHKRIKDSMDGIALCIEEHLTFKKNCFYLYQNETKEGKEGYFLQKTILAVLEDGKIKPIYESKYFDNLVPREKRDKIKEVEKTMLNTCIVDWGCEVPKLFLSPNVLNVYVCMEDKEGFKKYGVYTWPNVDYYLGQFEFHTFTPFCPYL